MPDPTHRSVSASQTAAMFNVSRFSSRWLLWNHFVRQLDWSVEPNERMKAGKFLQSGIIAYAADELGFTVTEHTGQQLLHHQNAEIPLSATKDASMIHPVWGAGIVEAKLVRYPVWKERWTETQADPEVVIQVHTQAAVEPHVRWLAIACYVEGGGLQIYKLQRDDDLIADIEREACVFMQSVRDNEEPEVEGRELELPTINRLYPEPRENTVLTLKPEQCERFDAACDDYLSEGETRLMSAKRESNAKALIFGVAKDYNVVQSQYHTVYMRVDVNGKKLAPRILEQENF